MTKTTLERRRNMKKKMAVRNRDNIEMKIICVFIVTPLILYIFLVEYWFYVPQWCGASNEYIHRFTHSLLSSGLSRIYETNYDILGRCARTLHSQLKKWNGKKNRTKAKERKKNKEKRVGSTRRHTRNNMNWQSRRRHRGSTVGTLDVEIATKTNYAPSEESFHYCYQEHDWRRSVWNQSNKLLSIFRTDVNQSSSTQTPSLCVKSLIMSELSVHLLHDVFICGNKVASSNSRHNSDLRCCHITF